MKSKPVVKMGESAFLEYLRLKQQQADNDLALEIEIREARFARAWWIKHIPRGKFPTLK